MKKAIRDANVELVKGDITLQDTEAIVNAANSSLRGGGGVDGAIHRAGGPAIYEQCARLGGCETGDAKLTTGGNLKAKYVIHAVGPVYQGGETEEEKLLANCYRKSLKIAQEKNLKSIAFPSISTGAYGYPVDKAANIAMRTVKTFMQKNPCFTTVRFVLFDEKTFKAYKNAMEMNWQ